MYAAQGADRHKHFYELPRMCQTRWNMIVKATPRGSRGLTLPQIIDNVKYAIQQRINGEDVANKKSAWGGYPHLSGPPPLSKKRQREIDGAAAVVVQLPEGGGAGPKVSVAGGAGGSAAESVGKAARKAVCSKYSKYSKASRVTPGATGLM